MLRSVWGTHRSGQGKPGGCWCRPLTSFPHGQSDVCAPIWSQMQASWHPPVTSESGAAGPPHLGAQHWGIKSMAVTTHFPGQVSIHIFSLFLSSLPGTYIPSSSLFLPRSLSTCVSFLFSCIHRSPSASFQLVFSENCCTCRSIFENEGEMSFRSIHSAILIDFQL